MVQEVVPLSAESDVHFTHLVHGFVQAPELEGQLARLVRLPDIHHRAPGHHRRQQQHHNIAHGAVERLVHAVGQDVNRQGQHRHDLQSVDDDGIQRRFPHVQLGLHFHGCSVNSFRRAAKTRRSMRDICIWVLFMRAAVSRWDRRRMKLSALAVFAAAMTSSSVASSRP